MVRTNLRERMREGLLLLDGAMGTQLMVRGVEAGTCNDYLNIESPGTVFDVHKSYVEAGSDVLLTNTFGANKYALARHGFSENVEEINKAGAEVARGAAGEERYVLGDVGPSGDFLQPLGVLRRPELKKAFSEQVKGLLSGDVDGFIVETMSALDEAALAVEAVRSVSDLPLFASVAFGKTGSNFRTMMGVDVESVVAQMVSLGVDAVGFNCGTVSLEEYVELAGRYASAVKSSGADVLILAEPNAGKPELIEDEAVYSVSPEYFAAAAEEIRAAGISIIGGCCGTSPAHIEAVARKLNC
ncbi:MAG: homocysteine S-methyltransferase family protein [Planctomycetota bacterium]|jgi:methionine synthase I (cobalamin-dependent)